MKKIIILILLVTISCTQNPKKKDMITSKNEKIVQKYFEHFNKHNWKEMAAMYTKIAEFKDPSLGKGIIKQTQQQTFIKYSQLNEIFPDLKDEIITIYPSGDKHIIVEFISSGTATDQTKFELPICSIFTIENGKITQDFTYYDNFEN